MADIMNFLGKSLYLPFLSFLAYKTGQQQPAPGEMTTSGRVPAPLLTPASAPPLDHSLGPLGGEAPALAQAPRQAIHVLPAFPRITLESFSSSSPLRCWFHASTPTNLCSCHSTCPSSATWLPGSPWIGPWCQH